MKALCLMHVGYEDLGSMEPLLKKKGYQVEYVHLYNDSYVLPSPDQIDALIIMGGPMSVNDSDKFPWIFAEKKFIAKCIQNQIPTIGVCLGAQLIASVLGSKVYKNKFEEVGWFDVTVTKEAKSLNFPFSGNFLAFHWHAETFEIPQDAVHIAKNSTCANQAFLYHKHVLALQFHLETMHENALNLCQNSQDLIQSQSVQSASQMLKVDSAYQKLESNMEAVIEWFFHLNENR